MEMRLHFGLLVTGIGAGVVVAATNETPGANPWVSAAPTCRSADDQSGFLIGALGDIVSFTDSTTTRLRAALQLPQMSAANVSLVTQAQTCTKAAAGLDAAQDTVIANRAMYVFKLGSTRFAVYQVDTQPPGSNARYGATVVYYFTNKWVFLSAGLI